MSDLFEALQQHEKNQDTNLPSRGFVRAIDGNRVNVLVRGGSTILRNVRAIGTPSSIGQAVMLTWENGVPTAHIVGGMASAADLVAISKGGKGDQGEQGPAGSLTAATEITLTELTETPTPPASGKINVYARDDHKIYKQLPDGTAEELGTGAAYSGPPVFSRVLTKNLHLTDTECLVVPGYLDSGDHDVELDGDADIYII
jgi:hypothetical protein